MATSWIVTGNVVIPVQLAAVEEGEQLQAPGREHVKQDDDKGAGYTRAHEPPVATQQAQRSQPLDKQNPQDLAEAEAAAIEELKNIHPTLRLRGSQPFPYEVWQKMSMVERLAAIKAAIPEGSCMGAELEQIREAEASSIDRMCEETKQCPVSGEESASGTCPYTQALMGDEAKACDGKGCEQQ